MKFPAVPIFFALVLGAIAALLLPGAAVPWLAAAGVGAWQASIVALLAGRVMLFIAAALASLALSSAAAALHTDWSRAHASLRAIAAADDARAGSNDPVHIEGLLIEDAAVSAEGITLRVRVERVRWQGAGLDLEGTVIVSVAGAADAAAARAWTRGRRIRAPALLRRPARHLNDGVADAEAALLRRGVALTGSIKSAALVEVIAPGGVLAEALARGRARIRDGIARVMSDDAEAAAVVTAILIGDRAGLSPSIERRMQRAGTYHVIAISGGNIALFAALAWGVCRLALGSRRLALAGAMAMVATYGLLVGSGASVGRAVAAALLLLCATLLDQRAPPLNVIAVVGIVFLLWDPLALTDLGFLLSFGATAAILVAVPRWLPRGRLRWPLMPVAGILAATVAAEIALLPIQATAFHRLTIAGLALNLIAIPAMALAQVGGMTLVAADLAGLPWLAAHAATGAAAGARALIDSASLVDLVPGLTWRVASPPAALTACYASACGLMAWRRWPRAQRLFASCAASAGLLIALSAGYRSPPPGWLSVSMFDVGQGEAIAIRLPSGRGLLVDAGGPADRFDIGGRVVVPALLARGITRLDTFALTHADADHAGGAAAVLADLRPSRILEGIAPALDQNRNALALAVTRIGGGVESLRTGVNLMMEGVLLRVLHPPPPDWERQKVRNDDSLVLELVFGDLSIVLTGDAGETVEPVIAAQLSPSPLRILKVGHHGSRTSTSRALIDAARPRAALISAGRGNMYGHPSPVVLSRLRDAGVEIFRTDRDGQIDVVSDGRAVEITSWSGRRWSAPVALQQRVDAAHDRMDRLFLRRHRPAADAAAVRADLVGLHER